MYMTPGLTGPPGRRDGRPGGLFVQPADFLRRREILSKAVYHYFDAVAGMPVPPARLRLGERLAAELGVDAEALLREVEGIAAGR
jgi:hypothetical protein